MADVLSQERRAMLAMVSDLYYVEGQSQKEIATQLGISRSGVSRLLAEARDSGVVEVIIHRDPPAHTELQGRFTEHFPSVAVSVMAEGHAGSSLRAMGDRAARLVERRLRPGGTLALTHGSTVFEVVRALRTDQLPGLRVVQMAGFELKNPLDNGWQLIRLCVDRLGTSYRYIHAPLLVASAGLHRAYGLDPDVQDVISAARTADVAIIGVGSVDPVTSSLVRAGHLTQDQLTRTREAGSVGAVNGYHFDVQGNLIDEVNERIVGLSPDDFSAIGHRVVVAGGAKKAPCMLGALRGGWIDSLVTDASCASAALDLI